ncbi:MAG: SEC-C domain-containing protein [Candidatus Melainabacteria bacterium]|nr:MAG: SEC-C domain-containing protein [Candidatus Melainabacteria bacterium]
MNGFKSSKKTYDVGIIFDKYSGFYAIPFGELFVEFLKKKIMKTLKIQRECVLSFLENDKISYHLFESLNEKYPNTFLKRINEILNTKYTFEELMEKYFKKQLGKKVFSPTSILYASSAFNEVLNCIEKTQLAQQQKMKLQNSYKEVGRNDLCPCGSGKKYKNCCLKISV